MIRISSETISLYGGISVAYANGTLYFRADDILHNDIDWATFRSHPDYDDLIAKYPIISSDWDLYHNELLPLALSVRSTKYGNMAPNEILELFLHD